MGFTAMGMYSELRLIKPPIPLRDVLFIVWEYHSLSYSILKQPDTLL